MKYIIDRFEGDFAVVELDCGAMVDIPKAALPLEASEGSVVEVVISEGENKTRKKKIEELTNDLFV